MSKDSVKGVSGAGEGSNGLSFTEFSYQLVQGYDFTYLYKTKNCKLQMGGSGPMGKYHYRTELIHRTTEEKLFALTCPLITKADGGKFGEKQNPETCGSTHAIHLHTNFTNSG